MARAGGPPSIGPLTDAATERQHSGPPPLVGEWCRAVKEPGDFVFFWGGATKAATDGEGTRGWSWLVTRLHEPGDAEADAEDLPGPFHPEAAARTERLLAPLAHESRIRLLLVLFEAPCSSSYLGEQTGMKGGKLYYHLKELLHAGYVREHHGVYALTDLGYQLLTTVTCIAVRVIKDRDEEGWFFRDTP